MTTHARAADNQSITDAQKKTWSRGDFHEIARHNVPMAERLCTAVDLRPVDRVLDVACGSGTAALVAARHYADVTGIDYVPELIERAETRARAEGYDIDLHVGDAQSLPFEDDSFDVVLSIYGAQFAPDQERTASELLRVCRPNGRIGLASPMPTGWSGDLFSTHGRYAPPPAGAPSPLRWGTERGVQELLGHGVSTLASRPHPALQYYRSVEHAVEVFSTWFGPTLTALERVGAEGREELLHDLADIFDRYNRATDGTAVVENTYLQTTAHVS